MLRILIACTARHVLVVVGSWCMSGRNQHARLMFSNPFRIASVTVTYFLFTAQPQALEVNKSQPPATAMMCAASRARSR